MVQFSLVLTCLFACACVSQGLPQRNTANVIEVEDPEVKQQIFEAFKTNDGQRSILYDSFLTPQPTPQDRLGGDLEIVVESVELVLTKAKNPDQKIKEKAEARRAVESNS